MAYMETVYLGLTHTYPTVYNVQIDNNVSHPHKISIVVPQGTILGPVLLLNYIYDFNSINPDTLLVKYPDDSTIV